MVRMPARYSGSCYVCGNRISVGDMIDYDRSQGGARHDECTPVELPADAIQISVGEGYGGVEFHAGDVIRNQLHGRTIPAFYSAEDHARLQREAEPVYLYVLQSTKTYYRHDGMSFGVGDESGYVYGAYCRPATDEESAALRAIEAREATWREAQGHLNTLRRRIETEGQYPPREKAERVALTVLLDKRSIYGGGFAWAASDGAVWYLQRNGGDGDDWSANNVGSVIGHFLPDPDGTLRAEVERLIAVMRQDQDAEALA